MMIGFIVQAHPQVNFDAVGYYLLGAFCLQIISIILGVISLFGIPKYGPGLIVWKAAVGILGSCGTGCFIFLFAIGISMGRNC
jgi:hypothetical protein